MTKMKQSISRLLLFSSLIGISHGVEPMLKRLPHEMETHVPGCMEPERLTISASSHYDPVPELFSVESGGPMRLKIKGTANVEIHKDDGIALYVWSDVMDERGSRNTLTPMKFSLCEQWTGVQCPILEGADFEGEIRWNAPIIVGVPESMQVSPVLLEEPAGVSCFSLRYGVTNEEVRREQTASAKMEPGPAVSSHVVNTVNRLEERTWTAEMSPRFQRYTVSDARRIAGGSVLRGQGIIPELKRRVYVAAGMIPEAMMKTERRRLRSSGRGGRDVEPPVYNDRYHRWAGWDWDMQHADTVLNFVRIFSVDLQKAISDHYMFLLAPDVYQPTYVEVPAEDEAIPESFDAREAFPECASVIGRVRDQSDCGSCWAFASTEAFNDRRCIAGIGEEMSTGQLTLLSAEDTTACCSGFSCSYSNGCNGGHPGSAWQWFAKTGVVTGGDYEDIDKGTTCKPYEFQPCAHHVDPAASGYPACPDGEYPTPQCLQACSENGFKGSYRSDKRRAKLAYSLSGVSDIQRDMLKHGSVTASFSVFSDFLAYSGGVYKHVTGEHLGGHAVKIIGWGTDEATGEDYWLVVNSWNDSWGENGLFRIRRGVNECGIEGQIVAGEA